MSSVHSPLPGDPHITVKRSLISLILNYENGSNYIPIVKKKRTSNEYCGQGCMKDSDFTLIPCGRRPQTTDQTWHNLLLETNVNILKFYDYFQSQDEKCIKLISTNMPSIALVNREIYFENITIFRNRTLF